MTGAEPESPRLFDVAVVGAGPVGCALALLLADRGRQVVLVERWPEPYPLPRAVHFDDETARILQACGLGPVLPSLSEPADVYEWQNAEGVPLLRLGTSGAGRSGWPSANMFNQPDLEAELQAVVDRHPHIDLRRGLEAVAVDDLGPEVLLTADPATSTEGNAVEGTILRARYLVGCDGANSFVRRAINAPMEDHGFFFDWLIVDVRLHSPRIFDPSNLQICDPRRPTTAVSGGPGRRRWEFMCLPGEDLDALDEEDRAWELLEPWDVTRDNATMVRHAGYRFQARWATTWQRGRVFLAGDAAHQTPPFAGQGMCAGLRDAANLAWKLHLVLDDPAAAAVLATYDVERIPHAAAVIGFAIELGKIICVPDPDEAAARDAAMAPTVSDGAVTPGAPMPSLDGGILALGTPGAGDLFVQGVVSDGRERGRFDDLFGAGWALVSTAATVADVPADLIEWFESIGGVVAIVGPCGIVDDVEDQYTTWFADHGASAVVQRPDFYVFGSAPSPDDLRRLLENLRSQLSGSPPPAEGDAPIG